MRGIDCAIEGLQFLIDSHEKMRPKFHCNTYQYLKIETKVPFACTFYA